MSQLPDMIQQELSRLPIFANLDREQVKELFIGAKLVPCRHRQVLFERGSKAEFFGLVYAGAFKLTRPTFSSGETIVHFATKGAILAALVMSHENPIYPITASSLGESIFISIPQKIYLSSWKQIPHFDLRLQRMLSQRLIAIQDEKTMLTAPLKARVADCLLRFFDRPVDASDLTLPWPITRKEIADYLGVTVESVIRIMSEWSKLGIITTNEQFITIKNPEQLLRFTSAQQEQS